MCVSVCVWARSLMCRCAGTFGIGGEASYMISQQDLNYEILLANMLTKVNMICLNFPSPYMQQFPNTFYTLIIIY